jgi:cytochrome c556
VKKCRIVLLSALLLPAFAIAGDDPIKEREELMEQTRDAMKPLGAMAKGEQAFDAAVVQASLETFTHAANQFGSLFPEGSETGGGTEAKSTIWTDRAGFNQALADFGQAVDAAKEANPQSVEELKPVLGSIGKTCKGCHDGYRVEDD